MKESIELICASCMLLKLVCFDVGGVIIFVWLIFKGGILGRLFCIGYTIYWFKDRNAHEDGRRGQGSEVIRGCAWYRNLANYFSAKVVKEVDLPPTKNYLFVTFPHGLFSFSVVCNFVTGTTNFRQLFPGIRSKACTLNYKFWIPFTRDLILSWGLITASRKSIVNALTQSNKKSAECNRDGYTSNAVVLVVGGAQEAFYFRPGIHRIVLNKRKGFVKIAIQTGAPLVPVYSFGETDILDQVSNEPGTKVRAFQEFVKKWLGFSPILFYGRGFTENSFGFFPYRRPLTTVIGAPIEVTKNSNPSQEEIDELHSRFVTAIKKLFDDHKDKYLLNPDNAELIIE